MEMFDATSETLQFSRIRNAVLDIVNEGRRKNTIYMMLEIDITEARNVMGALKASGMPAPTITSYMVRCFAKAVDEQKIMHAYRKGKKTLVLFDEVDAAVIVEKEVRGQLIPVHYILRAANRKSLGEIQDEIYHAKQATYEDIVPKIDRLFFTKAPDLFRRMFWKITRKDPKVKKFFSGTIGVTSVGMFGSGMAYLLPITPMTSTLAIGTLTTRPVIVNGSIVPREILCVTLCCDHDIVDGAPMMRFTNRLKDLAEHCFELPATQRSGDTDDVQASTMEYNTVFNGK
ncbi:MAG TPA: 2-oxo acid dehydrogenase subunit E2 [Candidatus Lokiarchaeia archaeon]|nr:2-oxo acid dehydrogenase subunit E2 [Candidatus Lokiarchaeia archaeon]